MKNIFLICLSIVLFGGSMVHAQVDDINAIKEKRAEMRAKMKEKFPDIDTELAKQCPEDTIKQDITKTYTSYTQEQLDLILQNKLFFCENAYYLTLSTSQFPIKNMLRASDNSHESELTIVDPESGGNSNILNRIIKIFTQVLGTFGVLMLVIGGVLMITSEGDENRLQKGKNIFFYTIVGLLVAFASFIAVQFIISILFTAA